MGRDLEPDELDRLRRILERIDPEQRAELLDGLEGDALRALAEQEEVRFLPAVTEPIIELDPTQRAAPLSPRDLAGFLPEVRVEIDVEGLSVEWHIGPAGAR